MMNRVRRRGDLFSGGGLTWNCTKGTKFGGPFQLKWLFKGNLRCRRRWGEGDVPRVITKTGSISDRGDRGGRVRIEKGRNRGMDEDNRILLEKKEEKRG